MIEKVRDKANELYTHFAGLFDVSVSEFARFFESTVTEFRDATKEMDKDALLELIVDPTITPAWGKLFLLRVVHFLKYKKNSKCRDWNGFSWKNKEYLPIQRWIFDFFGIYRYRWMADYIGIGRPVVECI